MLKYCPGCGSKLDENFKFCPECGTDLTRKFKFFTFCPSCGKKMPVEVATEKPKWSMPKLSLKISRKMAMGVVVVVCVVVVAAALIVWSPFDFGGTEVVERTFSVSVFNDCSFDVECYLKVGQLKFGDDFNVLPNETVNITINEALLVSKQDVYNMTLYATHEYMSEATAENVTVFAEFVISESVDGDHSVACTGSA